jgi:hypothetical protein
VTDSGNRWTLHRSRTAAFALLGVVTAYGIYQFAGGEWRVALESWRGRLNVLPVVLALAALDVGLEAFAAMWVYERFGIRAFDIRGALASLAIRAGLLLPAQLNRLIRPDGFVRLGRGEMTRCLEAEGATFVLDTLSVLSLIAGLAAWRWSPIAGPTAFLAVAMAGLATGRFASGWLEGTRFALPADFWWRGSTLGIVAVEAGCWLAHGAAFWVLVRGLPGGVGAVEAILGSAVASVLGAVSGAPGGVGVVDGVLGASLHWMEVPAAHMALAVLGFRLASFWLWIPIGWIALVLTRRGGAAAPLEVAAEPEPL